MNMVEKLIAEARARNKEHPKWDYRRCDKRSDKYERAYEYERNRYLRTMSHVDSITLPSRDAFDRLELIRQADDYKQAQSLANNIQAAIQARGEVQHGGSLGQGGLRDKNAAGGI